MPGVFGSLSNKAPITEKMNDATQDGDLVVDLQPPKCLPATSRIYGWRMAMDKSYKHDSMQSLIHIDCHQLPKPQIETPQTVIEV
jgi:hypothetical protein